MANANQATHTLDGLLHHECSLDIREHYTDTAGAVDHVFGLCHLTGFRFAPRIRDLADRRLYVADAHATDQSLDPMIGDTIDFRVIGENWDDTLRLAASIRAGTVAPSILMRRLAAYPKQNALAKTLREIGRLERTLFTLDWIKIRDRIFENQRYRASGLNLVVSAVILWNTVYLSQLVAELRSLAERVRDDLLTHIAPLGWEHISFNGDYVWPTEPLQNAFRPLRNPRCELLDAV